MRDCQDKERSFAVEKSQLVETWESEKGRLMKQHTAQMEKVP